MKTIDFNFILIQMSSFEKILVLIFFLFLIGECLISKWFNLNLYNKDDTFNNLVIGTFSFITDFAFSIITLPLLIFIYQNFRLIYINIPGTFLFIVLFILIDFIEYWFHRLSHQVNFLWAAHVVHHQSSFFNLSVGLRTSFIIPFFNICFYLPLPFLGFNPDFIIIIIFIQGIFQLFVHTKLIGRIRFIEHIFVTPSAHRVHHGKNDIYINKNYGKFFIFWDKLFHTYEVEIEEVVFGVKEKQEGRGFLNTILNPYIRLVKAVYRLKNIRKAWLLLVGNPQVLQNLSDKELK